MTTNNKGNNDFIKAAAGVPKILTGEAAEIPFNLIERYELLPHPTRCEHLVLTPKGQTSVGHEEIGPIGYISTLGIIHATEDTKSALISFLSVTTDKGGIGLSPTGLIVLGNKAPDTLALLPK